MSSTISGQKEPPVVLNHAEYWRGQYLGVHFKIVHWGLEHSVYEGKGAWNYYVYFREADTPDFDAMWLPDRVVKITPESQGFVTNDYMGLSANGVDWHGGVTFYAKHGSEPGYRMVEMGCDYAHLFDSERGYDYELQDVLYDCKETIRQLVERGLIAPSVRGGSKSANASGFLKPASLTSTPSSSTREGAAT